jgi:hypothetical protein
MQDFKNDPRKKQELRGRPIADKIYQQWLGDVEIDRHEREQGVSVLDLHFAIDGVITTPNGMILTGQEKFLSAMWAHYGSVTIEYWQNQYTHEPGDWFNLACQFYFCGYLNEAQDDFLFAYIMNLPAMVIATNQGRINWRHNQNNNGRALASFVYTRMADLPGDCIFYHYTGTHHEKI